MTKEFSALQDRIEALETRNKRVEKDKARETSRTRKISIIVITYIIATVVLLALGDKRFYLDALIPTIGYFLSTISVSWIEKVWRKRNK